MSWLGAGIDGSMIAARTVHFAAGAITAGALFFRSFVAMPALRTSQPSAIALVDRQVRSVAWIGLAVATVSGLILLWLQTVSMSGLGFGEAIGLGALSTVVDETQFGLVSEVRLILALALAVCLAFDRIAVWRRL